MVAAAAAAGLRPVHHRLHGAAGQSIKRLGSPKASCRPVTGSCRQQCGLYRRAQPGPLCAAVTIGGIRVQSSGTKRRPIVSLHVTLHSETARLLPPHLFARLHRSLRACRWVAPSPGSLSDRQARLGFSVRLAAPCRRWIVQRWTRRDEVEVQSSDGRQEQRHQAPAAATARHSGRRPHAAAGGAPCACSCPWLAPVYTYLERQMCRHMHGATCQMLAGRGAGASAHRRAHTSARRGGRRLRRTTSAWRARRRPLRQRAPLPPARRAPCAPPPWSRCPPTAP